MFRKTISSVVIVLVSGMLLAGCAITPAEAVAPEPTAEAALMTSGSTPEEVVQTFYQSWVDYATPDEHGNFNNPMVDEIYKGSPYLTPELITTIEETLASMGPSGYDPILCAQNTPEWIRVDEVQIDGEQASAVVVTSMLARAQQYHRVPVRLELRDGGWLISEINCFTEIDEDLVDPELADRLPDFLTYEDALGFHFEYPSSWTFAEAVIADESAPVDRVITFAPSDWDGRVAPFSLEISTSQTGEIPYSEMIDVNGLTFYVEHTPYDEAFYTVELPEGVRVALRDSTIMAANGDEDLISQWQPVIENFVYGFRFP